ncbi:hypothetical protein [Erwinia amylovora]|uniref:hypothetical protein n=1 Tax=Erwinia amylovora TaxID=552 RepID=UPI001443FC08|nr:hypothetical protein [Erwinia amylovora]
MWLAANLLILIAWFAIFAFNKNIDKYNKLFHLIMTAVLGYAQGFYGYAEPHFIIICVFVVFGVIISHLKNVEKITKDQYTSLYMIYITLSNIFSMRMVLLWAGVIE